MQKSLDILSRHLIIFTRYPEPGKVKTRLIGALGAVGAANLQRQMTEYTITQVKHLQTAIDVSIEVRFTGGDLLLMERWLGADLLYQQQGDGDLGARMKRSLSYALDNGADKVVIIGTDCPGISSHILGDAFEQTDNFDIVLGPALDGGYYLIGLGHCIPELFFNIDWGTSQVLQQTMDIIHQLNLSYHHLQPLADVDRPEDLPIWKVF